MMIFGITSSKSNNNDLIPIHGISNMKVDQKKLFDDLEESNNYLQESLGYPRSQKGKLIIISSSLLQSGTDCLAVRFVDRT